MLMFTFFMWTFGISFTASDDAGLVSTNEYLQSNITSHFSYFHSIEIEEIEFLIVESEIELEFEKDWISSSSKSFCYNENVKDNSSFNHLPFFTSKETIPLYDLYCNWKFHLS